MTPTRLAHKFKPLSPFVARRIATATASLESRRRRHSWLASLTARNHQADTARDAVGVHITRRILDLFERDHGASFGCESDGLVLFAWALQDKVHDASLYKTSIDVLKLVPLLNTLGKVFRIRHRCIDELRYFFAIAFHAAYELFNDWEGGDTTIPSPGRSPKHPLPGIGLHDPLHGRQACPESDSFHQGVGKICTRKGLFSCRSLSKRGQICYIPSPPQSLNGSYSSVFSLEPSLPVKRARKLLAAPLVGKNRTLQIFFL